tara:strand:+ start:564 stop:1229 length:666 start_codon:yes stop_codon:yes gene_type:complete
MAYPPQFSSTATYANRYDLDEIDVFLEGDSNNPMYFTVDGISKPLSIGKHYFNLSILDSTSQIYQLRPNSRILFEVKSINNVVLKSDISNVNQRNGVITAYLEVLQDPLRTFKEVEDGEGTLTIVASLEEKEENIESRIPRRFKGAMNYRCTFPIEIRKNLINANSPIITVTEHKKQTISGRFSFVKNNISAKDDTGVTYGTDGNPDTGYGGYDPGRGVTD